MEQQKRRDARKRERERETEERVGVNGVAVGIVREENEGGIYERREEGGPFTWSIQIEDMMKNSSTKHAPKGKMPPNRQVNSGCRYLSG